MPADPARADEPQPTTESAPRVRPAPQRAERVFDLLAAALAVGFLVALGAQAGAARFFTDECFHAHVARWIAAHGRLPRVIPELYSGYFYAYPPLFHLVGAAVVRMAGAGALPWLNLGITATLLGVLAGAAPRGVDRAARRWAVLLCAGNLGVATYALRFYAEALTCLLAAAAAALFLRLRSGGIGAALGLGVAVGLAITAKTSALALLLLPAAAALFWLRRGERGLAGRAALALGAALAVASPLWLRNQALFGSALYPALAPDLDPALYRLHLERYGLPAGAFFARAAATLGPGVAAIALAGLAAARGRRRVPAIGGHHGAAAGLVVFGFAALALAPALPVHDPRHVLPLVPVLAVGGAVALAPALSRPLRRLVDVALLGAAAFTLASLPGLRLRLDPPAELVPAYRAVEAHVPPGGTVLSLWTYDTFYWSGRAATWPIPWGQSSRPIEPFLARDPAALVAGLDRRRIDAVLAPLHSAAPRFDGSNYTADFLLMLGAAVESGALDVAWRSDRLALLVRRKR